MRVVLMSYVALRCLDTRVRVSELVLWHPGLTVTCGLDKIIAAVNEFIEEVFFVIPRALDFSIGIDTYSTCERPKGRHIVALHICHTWEHTHKQHLLTDAVDAPLWYNSGRKKIKFAHAS